jgi:hypothetical protein
MLRSPTERRGQLRGRTRTTTAAAAQKPLAGPLGVAIGCYTSVGWPSAPSAASPAALTTKPATGEDLEHDRLKARLGAALIERDLLNEKIAILEANRPLARRRLKP